VTRPAASSRTRENESVPDQSKISSVDLPRAPVKKILKRPRQRSAIDVIHALLKRPGGRAIPALAKATGWQPHSVRSFLSCLNKRIVLTSELRTDGKRRYSIGKGR